MGTLLFEQKAANVVRVSIVRETAASGIEIPMFERDFALGTTVNGFAIYNSGTDSGDENNLYANSIKVTAESTSSALVGVAGSDVTFGGTIVGSFTESGAGQDAVEARKEEKTGRTKRADAKKEAAVAVCWSDSEGLVRGINPMDLQRLALGFSYSSTTANARTLAGARAPADDQDAALVLARRLHGQRA